MQNLTEAPLPHHLQQAERILPDRAPLALAPIARAGTDELRHHAQLLGHIQRRDHVVRRNEPPRRAVVVDSDQLPSCDAQLLERVRMLGVLDVTNELCTRR